MNFLVSIIIPCYNQAQFLDECLQSVFDQTYNNWECIIVNDESPDNTEEVAKKWVYKDSRFHYFKKENSGVSATRNYGLALAKGDYIQFLDADDYLDKTKLEQSVKHVFSHPEINIVFTNFAMFSNSVSEMKAPYCVLKSELFTRDNVLYSWNDTFSIPIHCSFIKKEILENISFPTELTAQEDWFFWVKVFQKNVKIVFIDSPLAFYRINPKSRTFSKTISNDQMLVYQMFKEILSDSDFYKLSLVLISRYFNSSFKLKSTLNTLKNSNSYRGGKLIKKILKKIGLIGVFSYLLLKIEKWNKYIKN